MTGSRSSRPANNALMPSLHEVQEEAEVTGTMVTEVLVELAATPRRLAARTG